MSILETPAQPFAPADDDAAAIAALEKAFAAQRAAFAANRLPTLAERRERLQALVGMLVANRERISAAMAEDFGAHPVGASDLIEVLGVIGRAAHAVE